MAYFDKANPNIMLFATTLFQARGEEAPRIRLPHFVRKATSRFSRAGALDDNDIEREAMRLQRIKDTIDIRRDELFAEAARRGTTDRFKDAEEEARMTPRRAPVLVKAS